MSQFSKNSEDTSMLSRNIVTYVLRGDMRVTDLITHRYSPADAPEAYRMLREERATAMGALFDWTQL
jgi:threonine dehydrogenase-like Zn-dependent dehydrogenase